MIGLAWPVDVVVLSDKAPCSCRLGWCVGPGRALRGENAMLIAEASFRGFDGIILADVMRSVGRFVQREDTL